MFTIDFFLVFLTSFNPHLFRRIDFYLRVFLRFADLFFYLYLLLSPPPIRPLDLCSLAPPQNALFGEHESTGKAEMRRG